jgi:hypothetical protein
MNNNGNNSCKFDGDPLAYLYNEMPGVKRELFETHLADCEACTNEFAELSLAHYSVYEWQKLEFAPMQTPNIVIPYEPAEATWFDKVRAAFAFSNNWATAGAAFAVLAVAAFGGIVMFTSDVGSDGEIADVVNPSPSPQKISLPQNPVNKIDNPVANSKTADDKEIETAPPLKEDGAVRTSVKKGQDKIRPVPASANQRPANVNNRNRNVPRLNDLDDEVEDKSLRLTDIFDDLDTLE